MSGLRIHHPTLRDVVLVIPHPGNAQGRRPKDYHIHIDNDGDAIVSETVWMRLEEARGSGLSPHKFLLMNTVLDPPTLVIGDGAPTERKRMYRQMQDIAQEFAPDGVVPRITQKDK
jgi:hypothetical protein